MAATGLFKVVEMLSSLEADAWKANERSGVSQERISAIAAIHAGLADQEAQACLSRAFEARVYRYVQEMVLRYAQEEENTNPCATIIEVKHWQGF